MARKMRSARKLKDSSNVIQFKTAEDLAKDELLNYLKEFIYSPEVKNVVLIVNYNDEGTIGTFTSSLTSPVEALGILELAKNCFRG